MAKKIKTTKPPVTAVPVKTVKAFYSSPVEINPKFVEKVRELEKVMKSRVVVLWQNGGDGQDDVTLLGNFTYYLFASKIDKLPSGEHITVLLHSPGGMAGPAFKLASLLRRHCGGYTVVVPMWAKSAATLFALGADKIMMSRLAEFGPLDAQIRDSEQEKSLSALEVVQAIERLNSEAVKAVDQQMFYWTTRCGKKVETLLPIATHFVAEMMRPLFEKIDAVNFTAMARILKVAQDYAERLLERRGVPREKAQEIANRLTNSYSEHGYVIDENEMRRIGVDNVEPVSAELARILESLAFMEPQSTILGPLEVG